METTKMEPAVVRQLPLFALGFGAAAAHACMSVRLPDVYVAVMQGGGGAMAARALVLRAVPAVLATHLLACVRGFCFTRANHAVYHDRFQRVVAAMTRVDLAQWDAALPSDADLRLVLASDVHEWTTRAFLAYNVYVRCAITLLLVAHTMLARAPAVLLAAILAAACLQLTLVHGASKAHEARAAATRAAREAMVEGAHEFAEQRVSAKMAFMESVYAGEARAHGAAYLRCLWSEAAVYAGMHYAHLVVPKLCELGVFYVCYARLGLGADETLRVTLWFQMAMDAIAQVKDAVFSTRAARPAAARARAALRGWGVAAGDAQGRDADSEAEAHEDMYVVASQRRVAAPLITFERVTFAYPKDATRDVLHALSLRVRPGERVALLAPSGHGKSTVIKLLLGLYPPAPGGRVCLDGVPVQALPRGALRRVFALVPQEPHLWPCRSWRHNLAVLCGGEGGAAPDTAAMRRVLDEVGLLADIGADLDAPCRPLSGGQKQRFALARALLADRPVLLLDECTSAQDAARERALMRLLSGPRCRAKTVIAITHRPDTLPRAFRRQRLGGA